MRTRTVIGIVATAAAVACGGGPSETQNDAGNACASNPSATHWHDLYACYFGPSGVGTCGMPLCHGGPGDDGTAGSGFQCGTTADSCWHGMTTGIAPYAAITSEATSGDPTSTTLWSALRKESLQGLCNMPASVQYTFTTEDLARIDAWIAKGAPND